MKDRLRKVQFKYLDYLFENICWVKSKNYPNSTFFKKDDKVILELENSGTLWVLYSVWNSISDTFSIQYEETQQLIKEWMEAQLKLGEVAPSRDAEEYCIEVESQLKQVEITPTNCLYSKKSWIEAQLKSAEVTPHTSITNQLMRVQEELNSVEVTPHSLFLFSGSDMEEELKSQEITPVGRWLRISYETEKELKSEEVTPRNAIAPPYSWTNLKSEEIKPTISTSYRLEEKLKSEEIKPVKFYETELQFLEEQLKQEILKFNKNEKK